MSIMYSNGRRSSGPVVLWLQLLCWLKKFHPHKMLYRSPSFLPSWCVQVWNHNVLVDQFMGQVQVYIPGNDESRRYTER